MKKDSELVNTKKRVSELELSVAELKREVKYLVKLLNIKNNWHSEVHNWLDKRVEVALITGEVLEGKLKWYDKYQIAVKESNINVGDGTVVINKGAVAVIALSEEGV